MNKKMDVGFVGPAPMCIVDESCNFEGVEIIVDSSSSSSDTQSQDVLSCENYGEDVEYVPNSTPEEDNSYDTLISNLERAAEQNNHEDHPKIYLSTDVFFQSLGINRNCENMVGVIKIDPETKSEKSVQEDENTTIYGLYPSSQNSMSSFSPDWCKGGDPHCQYSFTFNEIENSDNSSLYINTNGTYTKYPFSDNELQCLNVLCDTSDSVDVCTPDSPEYIDVNDIIPQTFKTVVPPFLKRRKATKPENSEDVVHVSSGNEYVDGDDDVIFVREYNVTPSKTGKLYEITFESTETSKSAEVVISPNSTTASATPVRRRRRRRTFGEKRKNPLRKAQIDKASADLVEKLSIPPSVFNARVKKRNPKAQINTDQKNLRQSCRTTGAIFRPPSPLTKNDFRDWPVEGMHEMPFYNEETGIVNKLDFKTAPAKKHSKCTTDVLPLVASTSRSPENVAPPRKRVRGRRSSKDIQDSERLVQLTHDRFHMILSYAQELASFNALVDTKNNQETDPHPITLFEKNVDFHVSRVSPKSTTKMKEHERMVKKFSNMIQKTYQNAKNIQDVAKMLADTCTLYEIANGTCEKAVANYITSLSVSEGKIWLKKQL